MSPHQSWHNPHQINTHKNTATWPEDTEGTGQCGGGWSGTKNTTPHTNRALSREFPPGDSSHCLLSGPGSFAAIEGKTCLLHNFIRISQLFLPLKLNKKTVFLTKSRVHLFFMPSAKQSNYPKLFSEACKYSSPIY